MVSPLNPIGEQLDFYVETLVSPFERVVFHYFPYLEIQQQLYYAVLQR